MVDNSTIVDFAFKQITGIAVKDAISILKKKGVKIEDLDEIGVKYLQLIANDTEQKYGGIGDEYLILLHILIMYSVFKSSAMAYEETIANLAKDLGIKPSKYISIIYDKHK